MEDQFTINFAKGYIVTLVKHVGPEKAKKRLFEEGCVAFENEIDRVVNEIAGND